MHLHAKAFSNFLGLRKYWRSRRPGGHGFGACKSSTSCSFGCDTRHYGPRAGYGGRHWRCGWWEMSNVEAAENGQCLCKSLFHISALEEHYLLDITQNPFSCNGHGKNSLNWPLWLFNLPCYTLTKLRFAWCRFVWYKRKSPYQPRHSLDNHTFLLRREEKTLGIVMIK